MLPNPRSSEFLPSFRSIVHKVELIVWIHLSCVYLAIFQIYVVGINKAQVHFKLLTLIKLLLFYSLLFVVPTLFYSSSVTDSEIKLGSLGILKIWHLKGNVLLGKVEWDRSRSCWATKVTKCLWAVRQAARGSWVKDIRRLECSL